MLACNKRNPGAGCAALDGVNRRHAVLGVSDYCIAAYPGDFAQALIALDAIVDIAGPLGSRIISFSELHRPPGDSPHLETTLQPGELITGFIVPDAVESTDRLEPRVDVRRFRSIRAYSHHWRVTAPTP
jgi:xanthine dehydrogenase YagS FAD-binding subunit